MAQSQPFSVDNHDVVIIGAGAAGLMCAIEAGRRGRRVLLLDHAQKPAEKIRISGGGRCNFTNIHTRPEAFLSHNPRFCISALKRFTPAQFIERVERHKIGWHEKTLGQLFCDDSSNRIISMLLDDCKAAGVTLRLATPVKSIEKSADGFRLSTHNSTIHTAQLVIATGGKSIPKMGATAFGYEIAEQFGHTIVPTRAGLVPFTFDDKMRAEMKALAGISVDARLTCKKTVFSEGLLFTHRGLSGPSILQISSYWREGTALRVNLLPHVDTVTALKDMKNKHGRVTLANCLAEWLPKRLAMQITSRFGSDRKLADISKADMTALAAAINDWTVTPQGTEGYRTAEVTLGGVDTDGLSSQTMESKHCPGLYFIGEVVDVTGHLGGYNFQWAWASGHAAGQAV